jgi:hypothetical protein
MSKVIVSAEDLAILIVDWEKSASHEHDEAQQMRIEGAYARLQDPEPYNVLLGGHGLGQHQAAEEPEPGYLNGLLAQREMLREYLQKVLVHVGMIEPWAGLGDLDAFNDGPLLCVASEDFIASTPDAKALLTHPLFALDADGGGSLVHTEHSDGGPMCQACVLESRIERVIASAEQSDEIEHQGHKVTVTGKAEDDDIVMQMFTDTRPVVRMTMGLTRDDAAEIAGDLAMAATNRTHRIMPLPPEGFRSPIQMLKDEAHAAEVQHPVETHHPDCTSPAYHEGQCPLP